MDAVCLALTVVPSTPWPRVEDRTSDEAGRGYAWERAAIARRGGLTSLALAESVDVIRLIQPKQRVTDQAETTRELVGSRRANGRLFAFSDGTKHAAVQAELSR